MNAAPGNVLLACFEPPGYGGASTSGYQLYRRLRECLDARYLNLVSADDLARFQHFGAGAAGHDRSREQAHKDSPCGGKTACDCGIHP